MLDLVGTAVRDAGLTHLKGLTRLQWSHVAGTRISYPGIQELQVCPAMASLVHSQLDSIRPIRARSASECMLPAEFTRWRFGLVGAIQT